MTIVMIAVGTLIRQTFDFRDRLTKSSLPLHLRLLPVLGAVLIFSGFNGGTAQALMCGLVLCITCDIMLLKRR